MITEQEENTSTKWHLYKGESIEKCVICNNPTRYLSKTMHKVVCQTCAKERDLSEAK